MFDGKLYRRFCNAFRLGTADECWAWTGYGNGKGYGLIGVDGGQMQAHRLAYTLFVGPIPHGLHILHACDNPLCVNPRHLRAGTHADNMAEMRERRRSASADRNPRAVLSEAQARAIREIARRHPPRRGRGNGPCAFLARWFGVSDNAVHAVANGTSWRSL